MMRMTSPLLPGVYATPPPLSRRRPLEVPEGVRGEEGMGVQG